VWIINQLGAFASYAFIFDSPFLNNYIDPALLFSIVPLMLLIPATTIIGNALTRSVQLKMPPPAHCKIEFD
jgi:hypothetical protein